MARKARGPNATSAKLDPSHGKGKKSKKTSLAEEVRGMLPKSKGAEEKTIDNMNGRKVSASNMITLSADQEDDSDDEEMAAAEVSLGNDDIAEDDEEDEEDSEDDSDGFSDSSEGSEEGEIDVDDLEGIQDVETLETTDIGTIAMPDAETLAQMEASISNEDEDDDDDEQVDLDALDSDESGVEVSDDDEEDEEMALSDVGSEVDEADIVPVARETINNVTALNAAFNRIKQDLPAQFSLHHTLTTAEPVVIEDVNDDLKRELEFYKQGLTHAVEAKELIIKEGAAWERPADYFAEMVKTDDHMERIRKELVEEATAKKASADARRQRDLKKFGKQVQINKTLERAKEKKATTDKIKALKRKRGDNALEGKEDFDVALDEAVGNDNKRARPGSDRGRGGRGGRGGSRESRDQKYGFGGKKRFAKSNTAESTYDMAGFNNSKPGRGGSRGGGRGGSRGGGRGGRGGSSRGGSRGRGAPRPGKSKRA